MNTQLAPRPKSERHEDDGSNIGESASLSKEQSERDRKRKASEAAESMDAKKRK